MNQLSAIILAAGKGTRMKSKKPKVIFELAGIPLINRVIQTAQKANCSKIVTVVGYKRKEVEKIINSKKIEFVEQTEQNGTGHAVMVTEKSFSNFSGTIFILCGDVPLLRYETLEKMLKQHLEQKAACTVLTATMNDALKYGRIVRNSKGNVEKIVEFKDASEEIKEIKEINTGIYCFNAKDLFSALKEVNSNNAQNEFYLTDTLEILNKKGRIVCSTSLKNMVEASGVNSQKQLSELENHHYNETRNHWLDNGVQMENPQTILIGDDVKIANDVYISQNVKISGKSKIHESCFIGQNCVLNNVFLNAKSRLNGFNYIDTAIIDENDVLDWGEMIYDEE